MDDDHKHDDVAPSVHPQPDTGCDNQPVRPPGLIKDYLLKHSVELRELSRLRELGWDSPAGDNFFKMEKARADNVNTKADDNAARKLYIMMIDIGTELNKSIGAFKIGMGIANPMILDFCIAPGGFLCKALKVNKNAHAVGFTLSLASGGHKVLLPSERVDMKYLDITMLAQDLGAPDIPADHPDHANFLPRALDKASMFDLVICDGQVLRTHTRAEYRESVEARRLMSTQLVLGVEHVQPGGTIVMLLHKLDNVNTVRLLYRFSRFADVKTYKPQTAHNIKGTFYMVASNVQSRSPEALAAVESWRAVWMTATFGRKEEKEEDIESQENIIDEEIVTNFGPRLVELGKQVWEVQAEALAKAPFMKNNA